MLAHVEAEHLLLEREPLALVELEIGDRRAFVEHRCAAGIDRVAEQAHHALLALVPAVQRLLDDLLEHREQATPRVAERVERTRFDERLDGALVERAQIDAVAEVVEVAERAVGAGQLDLLRHTVAHVAHGREPEEDRALALVATPARVELHREIGLARVHAGVTHRDVEQPAFVDVDRGLVEVRLHRREQRREVLHGVVRLQVRGLVGDESVTDRVRLVERVVGERLDRVEITLGEIRGVAVGDATVDELRALLGDQRADLLAGGLAQVVGLFERVPGQLLRHPHQLLLVDHQPERGREDLLERLVVERDRLAPVLTVGVLVVPVLRHRARAIQGHERRDVLERGGREALDQRAASGRPRAGTRRSCRPGGGARTWARRRAGARRCSGGHRWTARSARPRSPSRRGCAGRGSPS